MPRVRCIPGKVKPLIVWLWYTQSHTRPVSARVWMQVNTSSMGMVIANPDQTPIAIPNSVFSPPRLGAC